MNAPQDGSSVHIMRAVRLFIRQSTRQDTERVADVLRKAARWLQRSGMAVWRDDELVPSRIAADVDAGLFFIAECDN